MRPLYWFCATNVICCQHLVDARNDDELLRSSGLTRVAQTSKVVDAIQHDGGNSATFQMFGLSVSSTQISRTVPEEAQDIGNVLTTSINRRDEDVSVSLTPTLTPAIAVAGSVLIISGLIFTLVGTKNLWIQVFFSVSYLVGLATTVLILFLVNPPISSAIQGAYLVAIFMTAVLVGGLSLIFKDMLEGMSAALGGFSWAMFLLLMHDGGLLTSSIPKAVFIACWIVGFYGLHFVRPIRPYVNIASTSLSGSTAIILGVDCYSRAGLKEFWVYIWNLNIKLFPDDTTNYLITRGIIVEITGIAFFTIIGILSQVRFWHLIKIQKDNRDRARRDEERRRDDLEAELGRIIEETQSNERLKWARADSDKTLTVSMTDEMKRSTSFSSRDNSESEILELDNVRLARPNRATHTAPKRSQLSMMQAQHDKITPMGSSDMIQQSITSFNSSSGSNSPYFPNSAERLVDTPNASSLMVSSEPIDSAGAGTTSTTVPLPYEAVPTQLTPSKWLARNVADKLKRFPFPALRSVSSSEGAAKKSEGHAFYLPVLDTGSPLDGLSISEGQTKQTSMYDKTQHDEHTATVDHRALAVQNQPEIKVTNIDAQKSETSSNSQVTNSRQNEYRYAASAANFASTNEYPPESSSTSEDSGGEDNSLRSILHQLSQETEAKPFKPHQFSNRLSNAVESKSDAEAFERTGFPQRPPASIQQIQKTPVVIPPAEFETAQFSLQPRDRMPTDMLRCRTDEWAKHLDKAAIPDFEDIHLTDALDNEPAATVDQADLLRTYSPSLSSTSISANSKAQDPTVPNVRSGASSSQGRRGSAPVKIVDQPRAAIHRVSSGSSLASSAGSLPRHSGTKRHSQRQLHPLRNNTRSVLASPIDEDSVASFSADSMVLTTNASAPRRASFPAQPDLHSTSDLKTRTRQSWSTLSKAAENPPSKLLSNDDISLSARRNQLRKLSSPPSEHYQQPPPRVYTASPKSFTLPERQPKQQDHELTQGTTSQYVVPEHTLRRASMLAEWRRSNSLEQAGQNKNRTPKPKGPSRHSYTGQTLNEVKLTQPIFRGYHTTFTSGRPRVMPVGNHGMIQSSIYNNDPKSPSQAFGPLPFASLQSRHSMPIATTYNPHSRESPPLAPLDVDSAHREALRRMQAGANRALKSTYTSQDGTNYPDLIYE